MKKSVSMLIGAALLIVGLVACPSDKTEVTPPPAPPPAITPPPTPPPAVTPPPTPPPVEVVTTELILNGGFEANTSNWTFSADSARVTTPKCVKTGIASSALVSGKKGFATISQTINIPAQGTTALKYWVRIETNEKPGIASGNLIARANETIINTLTTADPRSEYKEYTFDLSTLKGTSVNIKFTGTFNTLATSIFCIDDVSAINSR